MKDLLKSNGLEDIKHLAKRMASGRPLDGYDFLPRDDPLKYKKLVGDLQYV